MKGLKFVVLTVVLCVASSSFAALDCDPAPFRGLEGSTYQSWDFLTAANPTTPDVDLNPYGTALLTVTGDIYTSTAYFANGPSAYAPRPGVWGFEDNIIIDIPNNPVENPYKEVWLQITYAGTVTPNIFMLPEGNEAAYVEMRPDNIIDLCDGYYHATYHVIIQPNPDFEIGLIMPAECMLYVDDIILETICVPEPATIALLCVGFALIGRKK